MASYNCKEEEADGIGCDDDEELDRELDDMREFLKKEDELEESSGTPTVKAWRSQHSASQQVFEMDAQSEFAAAAAAADTESAESSTSSSADDSLALLGRRRQGLAAEDDVPLELSPEDLEHVRRELEHYSPYRPKGEAASPSSEIQASTDRVIPLDDMSASASFLGKSSTSGDFQTKRRPSTAAMAGLYEEVEEQLTSSGSRPTRPQEDEGSPLTYKEFLSRLMLPHSAELVAHVRAFVVRTLDEARACDDAVRARKPGATQRRREIAAALPERCAKFFDAAEAHLEHHPDWKTLGHAGIASSRAALEKYVMTKIGAFAIEACRNEELDQKLRTRCRALATFITPKDLDVKPALCNEVVLHIARDELRRMDTCKAPADKVDCVVKCASVIFSALNLSRAENSSKRGGFSESRAGADDFLPVFIYVVLRADAPKLVSNCDYIQAYHNPKALMSKAGYCFVNLRSAVEFLLNLTGDQIGLDNSLFDAKLQHALANLK